jgi:hypothetical protein
MNEPDPARRRDLHARRCAVTEEHLNPMYEEAVELERELTADLGAATVLALYETFDYDPRGVDRDTAAFTAETDALYREQIDAALRRRVGVGLDDASLPDFTRLWRAPEFDAGFVSERALPALRATLSGLGVDLDSQRNVELDIEARPGKRPRAFCAPIRVPDRVVLVILPQGGQDDYQALFHEAGHTEHFAFADPGLPAEQRLLGDNAVTEGFAFLFEHLLSDPAWLHSQLDFGPVEEYIRFTALQKLFFVRRYAGKLAYEIELHSGKALDTLPDRYAERLPIGEEGETILRARDALGFYAYDLHLSAEHELKVFPREEALRALLRPRDTQVFAGDEVSRRRGEGIEFAASGAAAAGSRPSRRVTIGALAGALIGGIVGTPLLFGVGSLIGALLGAFAGAALAVRSEGGSLDESVTIGFAALKGRLLGFVVKVAVAAAMVIIVVAAAI